MVNTVDVEALEFDNLTRDADTPDIQTVVLNVNNDNNVFFYYNENVVDINYAVKIDGEVVPKAD